MPNPFQNVTRPLIEAAESWEMEPVEHIFKLPDNEIKSDSESLTTARDSCAGWVAFVKTLQTAALGLPTEQPWAGKQLKELQADLEEWGSGEQI